MRGVRVGVVVASLLALVALAVPAVAAPGPAVRLLVTGGAPGTKILRSIPALDTSVVEVDAAHAATTIARLRADGSRVELDVPVVAAASFGEHWGPALVDVGDAWGTTTGSPSTVVAVLDTGVDGQALGVDLVAGLDVVDGDEVAGDDHGHGTAVAGVVRGYCPRCSLLPVRVLDAEGNGAVSSVAAGIVWATDNGADVINLSLSSPSSVFALASAVEYAIGHDVLVVAASGNQGILQPQYPASHPGVVGVTATDERDVAYEWANRGPWATLAAPGCHATTGLGGAATELCGTSSAAPAVAGIAALARSAAPTASADALTAALADTARPIDRAVALAGRVTGRAVRAALEREHVASAVEVAPGAPGAPRGVRAVAAGAGVDLSWSEPAHTGASPVLEYVVTTIPGGAEQVVAAGARTVHLSGLVGGVSYRFSVRARSATGDGPPSPPTAPVTPASEGLLRVAGPSRIHTAASLSRLAFASAPAVVLAHADRRTAVLTASPLAARLGGPLLLTAGGSLEPEVGAEIRRLGATVVHLVGGTADLPARLVDELAMYGVTNVARTAGANRFDTARLVAAQMGGTSVYVAHADRWADTVAVSGLAALHGRPILFVDDRGVPAETSRALRELGTQAATVVGGTAAISDAIVTTIGDPGADGVEEIAVNRHAGRDRYDTSVLLADVAVRGGADGSRAWLVGGDRWPDAVAAGPAIAGRGGVLLLVPTRLDDAPGVTSWLHRHARAIDEVVVVGGEASVSSSTTDHVRRIASL